jgi:hypothetical protein
MNIDIVFEAGIGIALAGMLWCILRGKKEIISKLNIAMFGFLGAMHLTKDYAVPMTVGTVFGAILVIMALVAPLFGGAQADPNAKDLRQ